MLLPHNVNFLTISSAYEWFSNQVEASTLFRRKVMESIQEVDFDTFGISSSFWHLKIGEAESNLLDNKSELEIISSFQLISAAEGRLKYDFELKQSSSSRPLEKDFSKIFKKKGNSMRPIDVETDILKVWKFRYPSKELTDLVGDFKRLMKFRHWVAHGRFWQPNTLGRTVAQYHPATVTGEIEALFTHLEGLSDGFNWK